MVSIVDRAQRLRESDKKILPPFEADPELCLYSPQDNVDALTNPRVEQWLRFVIDEYEPPPTDARRVLLVLPCTRTKPYVASIEHERINARLIAEGFTPTSDDVCLPDATRRQLGVEDPRVLSLAPLRRGDLEIARVVMSEPLAFVPYEFMAQWRGGVSPATNYDDPGLFENRGNAVSPWRADSTAVEVNASKWRWGDNEKRAYVEMHNAMSEAVATVLKRLAGHYDDTIAWVAPGLTHRSFCLAMDERPDHGVVGSRRVGGEYLKLLGANDHLDDARRIEVLPSSEDCDLARDRLRERLGGSIGAANAVFARGGGGATPLALPELLDVLVAKLELIETAVDD